MTFDFTSMIERFAHWSLWPPGMTNFGAALSKSVDFVERSIHAGVVYAISL
jgi:uncharacterized protein YegL